jgi:threonine dehydrogenase-like Zn-dependent dehydrogenase
LHAVQIAKLMGAYPVIAVDVRAARRSRAAAHGADVVVDPGHGAVAAAVLSATDGAGAAGFVGRAETIG